MPNSQDGTDVVIHRIAASDAMAVATSVVRCPITSLRVYRPLIREPQSIVKLKWPKVTVCRQNLPFKLSNKV